VISDPASLVPLGPPAPRDPLARELVATVVPAGDVWEVEVGLLAPPGRAREATTEVVRSGRLLLHWGAYRASRNVWGAFPGVEGPTGSRGPPDAAERAAAELEGGAVGALAASWDGAAGGSAAMRAPAEPGAGDPAGPTAGAAAVWRFRVPRSLTPLTIGLAPLVAAEPPRHHAGDVVPPLAPPRWLELGDPRLGGERSLAVPVGYAAGDPGALPGATLVGRGVDGAGVARHSVCLNLVSRRARQVSVALFRYDPGAGAEGGGRAKGTKSAQGKGYVELALDPSTNRTGDTWHVGLAGLKDPSTLYYAWRVGAADQADWTRASDGTRFDPGRLLLDPWSTLIRAVPESALPEGATRRGDGGGWLSPDGVGGAAPAREGREDWGKGGAAAAAASAATAGVSTDVSSPPFNDPPGEPAVWMGCLLGARSLMPLPNGFGLGAPITAVGDPPRPSLRRPMERCVAVEVDARAYGGLDAVSQLADPLVQAGVTTVVLRGINTQTCPAPGGEGVRGRAALSLLAPDGETARRAVLRAAADDPQSPAGRDPGHPAATARALRACIAGLQARGLEVVLGMALSSVADAGAGGSLRGSLSLRGIDAPLYLLPPGPNDPAHRSGGSALSPNSTAAKALALAAVSASVVDVGADGIWIHHAENLCSSPDGGGPVEAPPVAEEIAWLPALGREARLVAEVSSREGLPRRGADGWGGRGFPHWGRWCEASPPGTAEGVWAYLSREAGPGALGEALTGAQGALGPVREGDPRGLPGHLAAGRRPAFGWHRALPRGAEGVGEVDDPGRAIAAAALTLVAPGVPVLPWGLDGPAAASDAGGVSEAAPASYRAALPGLVAALTGLRARAAPLVAPSGFGPAGAPGRSVTWQGQTPGEAPAWDSHAAFCALHTTLDAATDPRMPEGGAMWVGVNPAGGGLEATLPAPGPGGPCEAWTVQEWTWRVVAATAAVRGVGVDGAEPLGGSGPLADLAASPALGDGAAEAGEGHPGREAGRVSLAAARDDDPGRGEAEGEGEMGRTGRLPRINVGPGGVVVLEAVPISRPAGQPLSARM